MPRRWRVQTVVSVAVAMASLDMFIVNIAFPGIEIDFRHSDVATLSWVLNAYAIVFAALLVSAGRLADRSGRSRGFLAGAVLFIAGSALYGLSPSVGPLIAARVVQAAGAAILMPTSLALLLPEFPPEERSAALGVWAAVGGVVEASLLRARSFAMANSAAMLFLASLAVMLLGNVLSMTGVWRESVLAAGLHLAPGPVMAVVVALPCGRLADRVGQRVLAALGSLIFALGGAWWAWRIGASPTWPTAMLPGLLITGAGVGMVLPSVASAVAVSLPPARFATGAAVLSTSRQIGAVLGLAALAAILGTVSSSNRAGGFDRGWVILTVAAALAAIAALAIGKVRQHEPTAGPVRADVAAGGA